MWFSNALIYRFTQPVPFTLDELTQGLEQHLARPCGSQELNTAGWSAPFHKHSELLVEVVDGYWLVNLQTNERLLPPSVVKDALAEKVTEIEERDLRKVYKRERDTLKDEIVMELLPRAYTRKKNLMAVIAPQHGWIAVDTPTAARAEDLLSKLREATGSLPVRPLRVEQGPGHVMSTWIKDSVSSDPFIIGDSCELIDTSEGGGIIRCKRKDLTSDEVQQLFSTGKQVTALSLHTPELATFTLTEQLYIKGLKYDDVLKDDVSDQGGEEAAGQLQATMAIMCATIHKLIGHICNAFGGEMIASDGLGDAPAVASSEAGNQNSVEDQEDELLGQAKAFLIESKRASISALQRKLLIGYNRAARLMEDLEQAGVVSVMSGDGTRTVLV